MGCGSHIIDGWINCDLQGKVDVVWDVLNESPFRHNSVDRLFSEHMLEHFTLDEGVRVLVRFRKLLRPGGRLRIAVPDLVSCIEAYLTGDGFRFRNEHQPNLSRLRVNAEYINKCFREHSHKFLYDEGALAYALGRAGFVDFQRFVPRESNDDAFVGLERRILGENSSQCSLCMEAMKPCPRKPSGGDQL